jgi:protein-S-isoprenylcysteine O-methyltransferase Ste14
MFWSWVKTVLILPLNVLVFIPAIVLYFTEYHFSFAKGFKAGLGFGLLIFGLILAAWTMTLFHRIGKGTAAPWNPPKNLVVTGPYRYVRNPMLTSVFIMQIAESVLLNSQAILIIFIIFFAANMIYFPLVEEKGLAKRFGQEYLTYKKNVPRFIPRIKPWRQ